MKDYKLEQYFDTPNVRYYEPTILITILEDILKEDLKAIKNNIANASIYVDRGQIEAYLDKTFEEENPSLKKRMENPRPRKQMEKGYKWHKITEQEIEESSQACEDIVRAARYRFEPYTLEYFQKYTSILKSKTAKILNIIEKIANKEYSMITELLIGLDIRLDENKRITKEDIIRLIKPFVYNYEELNAKINSANDLSTYLTFKLSKDTLYKKGYALGEIYPRASIQVKDLYYDNLPGSIPLSDRQRKTLQQDRQKSIRKAVKLLTRKRLKKV